LIIFSDPMAGPLSKLMVSQEPVDLGRELTFEGGR
jgi:hypothetical protein